MTGPAAVPRAAQWIAENDTLISRRGHRIAFRRRGSGPTVLLLHGFPTWSYDYAEMAGDLAADHDVITMDFLGYGASDKPGSYSYSVDESADTVEDLVAHLGLTSVRLVVHDYGGIVGQELVDRANRGVLPFAIEHLTMLNSGIVYSAYRPTRMQKLLILPVVGKLLAGQVSAARVRSALDAITGNTVERPRIRRPLARHVEGRRAQTLASADQIQRRAGRPSSAVGVRAGRLGRPAASGVGTGRSGIGWPCSGTGGEGLAAGLGDRASRGRSLPVVRGPTGGRRGGAQRPLRSVATSRSPATW